ncbi:MAG: aminotransferase class V-fold PLP-dependent enzyme [Legionellaceae bacterium]|nr:aminotransferase class V-fold PLP-dependent enzyme [Legionellaceae bacterium]
MKKRPIYFDYMATTPVDARVIECMLPYLGVEGDFGNPASTTHNYGQAAKCAVEHARAQIAEVVGDVSPESIIFTSGATEANNLAILGSVAFYKRKGQHVITMATEHKAVLDSFKQLEKQGYDVTYLNPKADGLLDLEALTQALRPDTILVSIMQVNNEIGVIQDIEAIGQMLKNKGIIFHVDAAQSVGRLSIDLLNLPVDLMSFSAHKAYGPKGIGALYVRQKPRIRLQAQSFGGGHEGGLRSGTLPTHQIVGMGEAFALAESLRIEEQARILNLRTRFSDGIQALPNIHINGDVTQRIAGNLNLCFKGMDNSELLMKLHELAISTTSACASSRQASSHVLLAMGLNNADAQSSLRFSFGRFTTKEEIDFAIKLITCKL